jgi:methylthioribose-1-phosphate isomerase
MHIKTIEWIPAKPDQPVPGYARIIDQTRLPEELVYLDLRHVDEVWRAIKILQVRGAPAIGIAAAMGVAIAAQDAATPSSAELLDAVHRAADTLATARPTAVNLFWALARMRRLADAHRSLASAELKELLAREAIAIWEEDRAMCRAIGRHGAALLRDGQTILTHCNAGGLATAQFGTALAPVYLAREQGKTIRVISDETRPLLQGSRLTAWELTQAGIEVTVICDNTAGQVMKEGRISAVLVGADRIAANGDSANKIGTYSVAVLARHHGIPFYVLAPTSTLDLTLDNGAQIPIEERDPAEVTRGFGKLTAPEQAQVYAPAFDVTPAELISAIICEHGVARADYRRSLRHMAAAAATTAPAGC